MRRSSILLIVLAVLAVSAGWWLLVIGPRNDAIADAEDRLFTAEQQGQQLRVRIQQLNDIKAQEISYLFAIGEMESSIPDDPEFDTFLEDLTFLAERSGVDLLAVTANPPVPTTVDEVTAGLFEIELNLSLEGQFFEILGFLFGLEEQERLIRVDTVSITPIVLDVEDTTTTTTLAPDGSTSSTSSTTTTSTTLDVRARPEPGLLSLNLTARLFTRTPVATPTLGFGDGSDTAEEGE